MNLSELNSSVARLLLISTTFWDTGPMRGEKVNPLGIYREKLLISKGELARKAGLSFLTVDWIEKGMSCRIETQREIILALGLKLSEATTFSQPGNPICKIG